MAMWNWRYINRNIINKYVEYRIMMDSADYYARISGNLHTANFVQGTGTQISYARNVEY
jgi:hypothetical protein